MSENDEHKTSVHGDTQEDVDSEEYFGGVKSKLNDEIEKLKRELRESNATCSADSSNEDASESGKENEEKSRQSDNDEPVNPENKRQGFVSSIARDVLLCFSFQQLLLFVVIFCVQGANLYE